MLSQLITTPLFWCIGLLAIARAEGLTICPLDAQQYPPPVGLSNAPIFQSAVEELAQTLQSNASGFPYNVTSFSIGVFTTSDDGLAWQYHHASTPLADSPQGATSVDADSVYRIGSVSKLTTTYLFLLCAGEDHWTDKIIEWIPELLNGTSVSEEAVVPHWKDITIGDLAGHIAGLSRDYGLTDFAVGNNVLALLPDGPFPPAPDTGVPVCGYVTRNATFVACTAKEYLAGVASQAPIFPTAYTPVYSNAAFVLIGVALERITGSSFEELFTRHLVRELDLNSTSYSVPPAVDEHTVVPSTSPRLSFWDADFGAFAPAGGSFSSTSDLAAIGKSILASRLLSPATTRRWLKPTSFANGLTQGVGRPWEIARMSMGDGSVVDMYTKAGDLGAYDGIFALIPTYNMGFTLFTAADPADFVGASVRNALPNLLAEKLVTAANGVARAQAKTNFVGTYTDSSTNSSITIAAADDLPGLRLINYTVKGADVFNDFFAQLAPAIDIRILPNHLYDGQAGKVGFTSNYGTPMPDRLFYGACYGWIDVDQFMFASVPMGQLVFDVDHSGRATAVRSLAFRVKMERVEE